MHTRVARVSVACHEPRSGPPDKPRSQSEPRRHVPHPLHFLKNLTSYQASVKSQLSTITAWAYFVHTLHACMTLHGSVRNFLRVRFLKSNLGCCRFCLLGTMHLAKRPRSMHDGEKRPEQRPEESVLGYKVTDAYKSRGIEPWPRQPGSLTRHQPGSTPATRQHLAAPLISHEAQCVDVFQYVGSV